MTTSTANPATTRVQALRARRKALGLERLELYAHPDDHDEIKTLASQLQQRRIDRKVAETEIKWTHQRQTMHTHVVHEGKDASYCYLPGASPQAVADGYLRGYEADADDLISFSVEDRDGNVHGPFHGKPNEPAVSGLLALFHTFSNEA